MYCMGRVHPRRFTCSPPAEPTEWSLLQAPPRLALGVDDSAPPLQAQDPNWSRKWGCHLHEHIKAAEAAAAASVTRRRPTGSTPCNVQRRRCTNRVLLSTRV